MTHVRRNSVQQRWSIGLPATALHEYLSDCKVEDLVKFAVKAHPNGALQKTASPVSAARVNRFEYDVVAEMLAKRSGFTFLDVGIMTFCEERGVSEFDVSDRISGRVSLNVDPFGEYSNLVEDCIECPPLVYEWRIITIWRKFAMRYEEVPATNIKLHGALSNYYLDCALVDTTPQYISTG